MRVARPVVKVKERCADMPKNIPLPPRRPADMAPKKEPTYPMSDIPVDPEYQKNLEEGYKTPKKPMVMKKAKGGMVRGCGMATRGHGKGRMC